MRTFSGESLPARPFFSHSLARLAAGPDGSLLHFDSIGPPSSFFSFSSSSFSSSFGVEWNKESHLFLSFSIPNQEVDNTFTHSQSDSHATNGMMHRAKRHWNGLKITTTTTKSTDKKKTKRSVVISLIKSAGLLRHSPMSCLMIVVTRLAAETTVLFLNKKGHAIDEDSCCGLRESVGNLTVLWSENRFTPSKVAAAASTWPGLGCFIFFLLLLLVYFFCVVGSFCIEQWTRVLQCERTSERTNERPRMCQHPFSHRIIWMRKRRGRKSCNCNCSSSSSKVISSSWAVCCFFFLFRVVVRCALLLLLCSYKQLIESTANHRLPPRRKLLPIRLLAVSCTVLCFITYHCCSSSSFSSIVGLFLATTRWKGVSLLTHVPSLLLSLYRMFLSFRHACSKQ